MFWPATVSESLPMLPTSLPSCNVRRMLLACTLEFLIPSEGMRSRPAISILYLALSAVICTSRGTAWAG